MVLDAITHQSVWILLFAWKSDTTYNLLSLSLATYVWAEYNNSCTVYEPCVPNGT